MSIEGVLTAALFVLVFALGMAIARAWVTGDGRAAWAVSAVAWLVCVLAWFARAFGI